MKNKTWKFCVAVTLLVHCSDEKENQPPVQVFADFTVSNKVIKAGEDVSFSDLSTGNPNAWNWIFDGGEPAHSNEQNPTIKYLVPGSYKVSLNASNGSSDDTEVKEGFIVVEETVIPLDSFRVDNEITFGLSIRADFMQAMITLQDSSFICVGWTDNENTPEQNTNILIAKFNKDLNLVWNKVIGGSKSDLVRDVIQTSDGGFLLTATTESNDGDIPENRGLGDIMIAKLNSGGDIEWIKTYGGSEYEGVNNNSLIQLENGYAFIGYTKSEDANISGKVALADIWLVEADNNGNIVNSFAIGSTENDYAFSFVKSSFGYVILSKIGASTENFEKPGIWIFEVNSHGDISWRTFIDGFNAGKLIKTQDNGYITINTNRNNVTDLFVTKFDQQGTAQWEKTYPLANQEFAEDIIQMGNEYIILGGSEPSGGTPRNGNAYVAVLNQSGNLIRSIAFGDNKVSPCNIFKVKPQKYVVGGTKNVNNPFVDFEFWLQYLSEVP